MNWITAFENESLYLKSKVFIQKALEYDANNRQEEFQLWATLSLELLGKATLSYFHPALTAEGEDSLLAACGIVHGLKGSPKTSTASVTFDRLSKVIKDFTKDECSWCRILTERRNAELHSGELPFSAVKREDWLGRFWVICNLLLVEQKRSLEEWIGESNAKQARIDIEEMPILLVVSKKLEGHKAKFEKDYPTQEEKDAAMRLSLTFSTDDAFEQEEVDRVIHFKCPACGCSALLGGSFWEEGDSGDEDGVYFYEIFSTELIHCRICNLKLEGRTELNAAKIPDDFELEKEFEFDDYGND